MKLGFKTVLWVVGIIFFLSILGNILSPHTTVQGVHNSVTHAIDTATLAIKVKEKETPTEKPTSTPTSVHIALTSTPTLILSTVPASGLSNDNYYDNVDGNQVHSPAYSNSVPAGATAICGDGTYSFSQHRSGTCSHHGGVSQWL